MDTERPAVLIYVHEAVEPDRIREMLLGIEEEGVPAQVSASSELNPLELASSASIASRLGVGVGVSLGYVVVTTEKLPARRPYLAGRVDAGPDHARAMGANAARIVKRMPLLGFGPAERGRGTE
jgi:hypothetical protein